MNDSSFDEILEMSCEERYEIFLSMVAEERDIWILVNENKEFLKIHSEDLDLEYLPVWPHSDFAEAYCQKANEQLTPKSLSAPEFFAKWVPGLEGDGLAVGVFPNGEPEIWITEPAELKADLQEEFSNISF